MKGAKYQKVFARIWTSPDFREWDDDCRMMALYILTCPHRNTEGLFRLPLPFMQHDLGWELDRTKAAFAVLEAAGFIATDSAHDLVWIKNALKWDTPKGSKRLKGATNALSDIPDSPLRSEYLESCAANYPDLADSLVENLGWNTLSDTPSKEYSPESSPQQNTPSNTQAPSPSPSPYSPPPPAVTPIGNDKQVGGGGEGASPPAEETPAGLVHQACLAMGYADPLPATPGDVQTVKRAMKNGWTPADLIDAALDVQYREGIDNQRAWWLGKIAKSAPNHTPRPNSRNRSLSEIEAMLAEFEAEENRIPEEYTT